MKWIYIAVTYLVSAFAIPVEKIVVKTEPSSKSERHSDTDVSSEIHAQVQPAIPQFNHQVDNINVKSLEKLDQPIAPNLEGFQPESSITLRKVLIGEDTIQSGKVESDIQSHTTENVNADSVKQISQVKTSQDVIVSQTKQAPTQSITSQLNPLADTSVPKTEIYQPGDSTVSLTKQVQTPSSGQFNQQDTIVKSLVGNSEQTNLIEKPKKDIELHSQKLEQTDSAKPRSESVVSINVKEPKQNVNQQVYIVESLENKEQVKSKTPEINVQEEIEIIVSPNVKQHSESIVILPVQESKLNVKQQVDVDKSLVKKEQLQNNESEQKEQHGKAVESINLKPKQNIGPYVKQPFDSIDSFSVQESRKNVKQQVDFVKSLVEKEQLQNNKPEQKEQHEKDIESTNPKSEQRVSPNVKPPFASIASLPEQESKQVDLVKSLLNKELLQSNKPVPKEQHEKDIESTKLKPEQKVSPNVNQPSESIASLPEQESKQVDLVKSLVEKELLESNQPELKEQNEKDVEPTNLKPDQKVSPSMSSHVKKISVSIASPTVQESRYNVNADIEASSVEQIEFNQQVDTFSNKQGQNIAQSDDVKLDDIVLRERDPDVTLPSNEQHLIEKVANTINSQSNRQVEATKQTNQVIHDTESLKIEKAVDNDYSKSTQNANALGTSVEQDKIQNADSHYELDALVDINLLKHKTFQEDGSKFTSSLYKKPFHIVHYVSNRQVEGSYEFRFETENGITRKEEGQLRKIVDGENQMHEVVVVRGSYQYPKADGTFETVTYFADETGYHAEGDSIPKAIIVSRL